MAKNGNAYRQSALKDLSGVDAETVLKRLVEKGHISAETVNTEVDAIRSETRQKTSTISSGANLSNPEKVLSPEAKEALLKNLRTRFEEHMKRHQGILWSHIHSKLESRLDKEEILWTLNELEKAGHQMDVIKVDREKLEAYLFFSCSQEAPAGHRNIVYDRRAQDNTHSNKKVSGNAVEIAAALGVELGTEELYMHLQNLRGFAWAAFDQGTWVWLRTNKKIRDTGNALYGHGISSFGRSDRTGQFGADIHDDNGSLRVALWI